MNNTTFRKYFLPGFVFQSVVIAGGYGTGREIIEYFLQYSPFYGLLGMVLITTVMWSAVLAVTFEFCRVFKTYDYRSFVKGFLGKYWLTFEFLYIAAMLLILAVVGSAAGLLIEDNFGLPYLVGVFFMMTAIGVLTFMGSGIIGKFLAWWSFLLYILYAVIFVTAIKMFGINLSAEITQSTGSWAVGGFKYSLYNFCVIPAVLFCLKDISTRKEAISAGVIGGALGILPGILFFMSVTSFYPEIITEEIPIVYLLKNIDNQILDLSFQIVLFGTLIESGTGLIHAFNERVNSYYESKGRSLTAKLRPIIATVLLFSGLLLSKIGIIDLIAQGYGNLSWGLFFVFVIPLFTLGIIKIRTQTQ